MLSRDIFRCEPLESRRLLTTVLGSFYSDHNYSGTHDAGELSQDVSTATVYIDSNNNGVLDAGETQAVTNGGTYVFGALDPGTYTLRAVAWSGFVVSDPSANGARTITVPTG